MKLLMVSPFPYSESSGQGGATICSKALLELKKKFDIGVLCFQTDSLEDIKAADKMRQTTSFFQSVPLKISKFGVLKAKIFSMLTSTPEHAFYFDSDEFRVAISCAISKFSPDIVICQFPQMAQYLPLFGDIPVVQDIQDAFSVSWYRRAITLPKGLRQRYAFRQWQNWVAYERKYYSYAKQCWTLSDQDKFGLTIFNPKLSVHTVGLPLIDFVKPRVESSSDLVVGFIGSYSYPPNVEALHYLLTDVVARVTEQMPSVNFLIAGRNPPATLRSMAAPNVRFVGFVDSLDDFYGECLVVVAPILSGGGVKIKVAEALSYGKAVVTTSVGAEGMTLAHGENIFIADDPRKFSDAVIYLLGNETERNRLSRTAGECAQQLFSAQNWSRKVAVLLEACLRQPGL